MDTGHQLSQNRPLLPTTTLEGRLKMCQAVRNEASSDACIARKPMHALDTIFLRLPCGNYIFNLDALLTVGVVLSS